MTKRTDIGAQPSQAGSSTLLELFDATPLVGLKTIVRNGAMEWVDENGEVTIEIPKVQELKATAAIKRCLMPLKLRGCEMKAMRKIMKMTLKQLAGKMDGRTAPETIARWESESQPIGGYAEKVFRLLACETLAKDAPGIEYHASMIAYLKVLDPCRMSDQDYEVPPIELELVRLKELSGTIIEAWDAKMAA